MKKLNFLLLLLLGTVCITFAQCPGGGGSGGRGGQGRNFGDESGSMTFTDGPDGGRCFLT